MWDIEVELEGNPLPGRLCRCESPDVVAAIVLALCRARTPRPVTVRLADQAVPNDPPGYDAFKGA